MGLLRDKTTLIIGDNTNFHPPVSPFSTKAAPSYPHVGAFRNRYMYYAKAVYVSATEETRENKEDIEKGNQSFLTGSLMTHVLLTSPAIN